WRMVSEYANGHYGWVLSLMFAAWGMSSFALAFVVLPEARTPPVKIGLVFLTLAGIGQAMAAVFDLNHDTLHGVAGALGMLGLPIAATLISVNLSRRYPWSAARRTLILYCVWVMAVAWCAIKVRGEHTGCGPLPKPVADRPHKGRPAKTPVHRRYLYPSVRGNPRSPQVAARGASIRIMQPYVTAEDLADALNRLRPSDPM